MQVDLETIVQQGQNQVCAEVGDEVVMMSIEKGNYYALDTVGTRIWELIAKPRQVVDIRDRLMSEYSVDQPTCETDILNFLNLLAEENLIEMQTGQGTGDIPAVQGA